MNIFTCTGFVTGSVLLVYLCRHQIIKPGCHGFYRFWVFEIVLWQFLYNLPLWNQNLISLRQLFSTLLLFIALYLLISGLLMLRRAGRRTAAQADDTLFGFESTSTLVISGIYLYIRHPMYSALLLFNWGVFFKHVSYGGLLLAGLASGLLYATALAEEKENTKFFGEDYEIYKNNSKMFVPFLI